jgi:hypothetical protein
MATAQIAGAATPSSLSSSQVVARFRAHTEARLRVDPRASYPGHYAALGLPLSIANTGRFGHFTVWVVSSGHEEDVHGLLANAHTGLLGSPGPSSIYWEHGKTISGTSFWLAKKRYGPNIVLWWYGSRARIDATFQRLHRALSATATGS